MTILIFKVIISICSKERQRSEREKSIIYIELFMLAQDNLYLSVESVCDKMYTLSLTVLTLLLPLSMGVFKGRPGLYTRLFDISGLCPHLSFAQPWSSEAEGRLTLLRTEDNVSLALDMLSRPPSKTRLESLSGRNMSRCNSLYSSTHCGPLPIVYHQVVIGWPGGEVRLTASNITVIEDNIVYQYKLSEVSEVSSRKSIRHSLIHILDYRGK